MEDSTIIELYFDRNEKAIDETAKKYGNLCFKIANNILLNHEDSEECVNDTYMSLWTKIPPTYPTCFTAFICRIVRFLSIKKLDYNSALKRSQHMTILYSELEDILPSENFSPHHEYEDIGKLISLFLRKEKKDSRNVFIRKYYFFDSISEIAHRYSFSESKIKNMLYHSRIRLRNFLRKEGVEI